MLHLKVPPWPPREALSRRIARLEPEITFLYLFLLFKVDVLFNDNSRNTLHFAFADLKKYRGKDWVILKRDNIKSRKVVSRRRIFFVTCSNVSLSFS